MTLWEDHGPKIIAAILTVVAAILTGSLVSAAHDSIEPDMIGLHYDSHRELVRDDNGQAFAAGKYYLGLGSRFLKFPATVMGMQFTDLHSRTSDGLGIWLSINFDYQLDPFSLMELYRTFGEEGYVDMFRRIAENVLKVEATQYEANEFFTNRTTIGFRIEQRLRSEFIPQRIFAKVMSFQLLEIRLPKEFETAVSENKLLLKDVETKTIERTRKIVEWNTTLLMELQRVNVDLKKAEAEATKKVLAAAGGSVSTLTKAKNDAATRILDAESLARTLIVDANSNYETRKLDATAEANKLLLEAQTTADAKKIEAKTYAAAKLLEASAKAKEITVANEAYVSAYTTAQNLQADAYVKVWTALGKDENKFLDHQELKALNELSWKDWTINSKAKTPFDLVS
jgi:regulator of protease activity HflC (stomatin/prohibitin superfamily)